jgi:8-oxo-dGTP diphosphatase
MHGFCQQSANEKLRRVRRLERKPTFTPVVAAAIFDGAGRVLLQQCLPHKRHAGRWEFPGGKVESGETPRFALRREIAEELAIELSAAALEPAGFADEASADGAPTLVLFLYRCAAWHGQPTGLEGQQWGWFSLEEACALDLPPMDRTLLDRLAG